MYLKEVEIQPIGQALRRGDKVRACALLLESYYLRLPDAGRNDWLQGPQIARDLAILASYIYDPPPGMDLYNAIQGFRSPVLELEVVQM